MSKEVKDKEYTIEEDEDLSEEDKTAIKGQIDDLSSKIEQVSKDIVKVLQDNNLTPIQAILVLKAISDGIIDMMNTEMEKQKGSVPSGAA